MLKNDNHKNITDWLEATLKELPAGARILDAGAGELRNKSLCEHLEYVSQDFGDYDGGKGSFHSAGHQTASWDTSRVDIRSDITDIPVAENSFDYILCSEVFEHIPDPLQALKEFSRIIKPGGKIILTAPFCSLVHMAPYHFNSGFSRYWYEYHLPANGFKITELTANGDWFEYLKQEIMRLGSMERRHKSWTWPLAYCYTLLGLLYFKIRPKKVAEDLGCFGWFCVATKEEENS